MAGYITDRDGLRAYVTDVAAGRQVLRFGGQRTPAAVEEFALDLAEWHEDLAVQAEGWEEECGPGPWAGQAARARKRADRFLAVAEQARAVQGAPR